jgi:peptide deformylase
MLASGEELGHNPHMAIRRIRQLGDPILRQVCAVTQAEAASEVIRDLRDTLRRFQEERGFGRGIAAPQIGEPVRVIHLQFEGVEYDLVNPRYLSRSAAMFELWDDCFSFPDLLVRVRRHVQVDVEFEDTAGETRILRAEGALAELLQHEIDHLDGILAVDRALDRDAFRTREEHERQTSGTRVRG